MYSIYHNADSGFNGRLNPDDQTVILYRVHQAHEI